MTKTDKQKPDISATDAMKVLRAGLNESRPATAFDWEKIERVVGKGNTQPPEGSITVMDFMEKYDLTEMQARRRIDKLISAGHLQTGLFNGLGRKTVTRFYWIVEAAK